MIILKCEICTKSKLTKKSFKKDRDRANRPCEIVHVDLIGPITPPTFIKRNVYVMCVVDDFTRYLQVFLLKSKTETVVCMNEALRFLQALFPGPGQFNLLRCDQGLEFRNADMKIVLEKYGIVTDDIEPYCHEHNGLVERMNRTIQEKARALIFESGFPTNVGSSSPYCLLSI